MNKKEQRVNQGLPGKVFKELFLIGDKENGHCFGLRIAINTRFEMEDGHVVFVVR